MRSIHNKRYKAIIAFIRRRREEAGITQKEMTKVMHLRQGIISKIETCERRIDLLELLQYCGGGERFHSRNCRLLGSNECIRQIGNQYGKGILEKYPSLCRPLPSIYLRENKKASQDG